MGMTRSVHRSFFPRASGSCCPLPGQLRPNLKLLLLDEITANLDAETEKSVLAALKRVAKDRTVISISHRTSAELGRTISI